MKSIVKSRKGLELLKEAIIEEIASHPEGVGNSALARSLELYDRLKKHVGNQEYKEVHDIVAELKQIEIYGPVLIDATEKHLQSVSKKLAEEAQEAVLANQWDRARELLAQAVAATPNDADVREMLQEVEAELAKRAKGRNRRKAIIRWSITCAALVLVFCSLRWACNGCMSWMRREMLT